LPFAQAAQRLRAHDGVALSASTIRRITERHAGVPVAEGEAEPARPTQPGVATVIADIDGGMVPPVQSDPERAERRRGKRVNWKDATLSLAHAHGSTERTYGATLNGGVEVAGRQLLGCAIAAGPGTDTRVQALGDGATWIADQVAKRFGTPGRYTVDFLHVCGYLADAAGVCAPEAPKPWCEQQKARLQANDSAAGPATLRCAPEPPSVADAAAPVRACSRDPSNRPEQLEANGALANGLPIGSGEIESAHRYVAQQRLKRPGAWWTSDNAEAMLALRIHRANGQWDAYWMDPFKQTA
jgi:hypothetical protein